jgi:hypothetical protein
MSYKSPSVIALRALRKGSHLARKVATKGAHVAGRVENRVSRLITDRAGSPTGRESQGVTETLHKEFPFMTPVHPALPQINQEPSVTVFAFLDPRGFYGGIATLLLTSAALANKLGYSFRVAQTTGYSRDTQVLKFLKSNGIIIEESRFSTLDLSRRTPYSYAYLPLHKDDIVMVSAWWDAHIAAQLPLERKFIYLIQDYEPIFYNNSDSQIFAEQTYHSEKFIPFCNTELLHNFFADKNYKYIADNATFFEPAVGKEPDLSTLGKATKKKLFLYARPSVHRNLFYSAIQAIDKAFADERLDPKEWELYCAGQKDVANTRLANGLVLHNLGKMELGDYYKFARSVDVTVSPMLAPHPNYPTLELASLGSMVVSTKYDIKKDLSRYSQNIIMAEPTVDDMAAKITTAALTGQAERIANLKHNDIQNNWPKALDKPLDSLVKMLEIKKS